MNQPSPPPAASPWWRRVRPFGVALAAVAAAVLLTPPLEPLMRATPLGLFYLAVLLASSLGSTPAGGLAVALSLAAAPGDAGLVSFGVVSGAMVLMIHRIRLERSRAIARGRELAHLNRLHDALLEIGILVARARGRDRLFDEVCRILGERAGFGLVWIGWHDAKERRLVPVAQWGDRSGYLEGIRIFTDDRAEGRGPSGTAFRENRPYIANDFRHDPATLAWREKAEEHGLSASAAFPIREGGAPRGVLNVCAGEPGFFQQQEVTLLEEVAGAVSAALDTFTLGASARDSEESARRERELVDTILESVPGVIYLYDEDGRFLRWNRHLGTVTGYTDAEIATLHPLDLFPPEEAGVVGARIAQVFATGEGSVEAGFRARDGTVTPHYFTGRRVMVNGRPCLVGMGIDITERVAAQQAILRSKAELERMVEARTGELQAALVRAESADRLKSAFLATMSHELRTPLNSIIGFTGTVLKGLAGPLTSEQEKQLGMVRGSARHLLELINDVLDISKIEAGQLEVSREPVDLRAAIERASATVRPLAEQKGLRLALTLPATLPDIVSDARRVHQILLNLLNNAVKFTDAGTVSLVAECGSGIVLGGRPGVRIQVSDTGIGIRPADLETLFQPFRQVDAGLSRQQEGTGLGLAICYRLVTLLGGEISATSVWGSGSTFTVALPLDPLEVVR